MFIRRNTNSKYQDCVGGVLLQYGADGNSSRKTQLPERMKYAQQHGTCKNAVGVGVVFSAVSAAEAIMERRRDPQTYK